MDLATWAYTLASVMFVSLLSLIGIFTLSLREERFKSFLLYFVSFAVGGLYGDAFIHLLPEAFKELGINLGTSLYVLAGLLLFFVIEKFIRWSQGTAVASGRILSPLVPLVLIVDSIHNMIDGMIIGASFIVSFPLGLTTTLAVVFHEIPHEVSDFAVLVHGGLTVRRALIFNFLSALTAILGGIISLLIGETIAGYATVLLPVTAGGFIYIAGSDLVPELQQDARAGTSARQFLVIAAGVAVMALLLLIG
jgi:zinc and cadmium transporter